MKMLPTQWASPSVRFTRGGAFFCVGTLAVGVAAVHSGNNLLFLLLGGMLGTIAASGAISSVMLRRVSVERRVIGPAPLQLPLLIEYRIRNTKRFIPTYALTVGERGLEETAYVHMIPARTTTEVECAVRFAKRGTYDLDVLTLSTGFPFGLFVKLRRVRRPAELIVWPRNDHPVDHLVGRGGGGRPATAEYQSAPQGARGEFRSLREFRPGDDRRDIHWRSSARAGQPVVREYFADTSSDLWLAIDPRGEGGERAEEALEAAASLATAASAAGRRFGVSVGDQVYGPGCGTGHLHDVLTALARLDFTALGAAPVHPPGAIAFSVSSPRGRLVESERAVTLP